MNSELKTEQKLELKLKLELGYNADFMVKNVSDGPHLLFVGPIDKNKGNMKRFHNIAKLTNSQPSVDEVRSSIWNYYVGRKLQNTVLSYRVFDLSNVQIDGGYIQDKFDRGLLNSSDYQEIEEWKGLPFPKIKI